MRSTSSGQRVARRPAPSFGLVAGVVVPCLVAGVAYFGWMAGRFAIVLIPLLAVGLLLALERSTTLRLVAVPLALLAVAAVVEGYRHYASLYGAETGHLRVVQDLSHVLPGDRLLAPNGLLLAASWIALPFAAGVLLWMPSRGERRQHRRGH